MQTLLFIVLPICLATSFLCAGMEAGIFALGRWRIAQQMRAGQKRAARLYNYLQNTENFLWTILVANVTAVFFSMWIVAVALNRALPKSPVLWWLSFLASAFVFYTLCDLLPKALFRKFPNRLCLLGSGPFRFLHTTLAPAVALVEGFASLLLRFTGGKVFKGQVFSNRNELRSIIEDPGQALTSEERGMISRVFDLHNISVRQIATPFSRTLTLKASEPLSAALARFQDSQQNLVAAWADDGRQRRIAGFLDLKRVIFDDAANVRATVASHLSPAFYLDEDLRVHDALRRMQRTGQRIAVVLSRDRRELGVVTLESILKAIFGEVKL
jgi:CBS domain containing-hemolysin-like protein